LDSGIAVEIVWFDDDLVELRVRASNGRFAAAAELCVNLDALATLAGTLAGFPTSPADVRECTLGNFDPAAARGGVRLRLACTDALGHAAVRVTVRAAGTAFTDGRKTEDEFADLTIPVEPAAIDAFVEELRRSEIRTGWRAHLRAEC
jgi:hypothetical protein